MESRRLKNKKQELESYQKRVVAYAKRQKNPLYMLGDWLLTLCALGIILVEEIYKFFRYRLNLESFNRFLREDVRWYRVWIHFTLAFLLPVMIFSIGITSQSGSFWSNFYHRLSQGVLFSTTVSLAATLVTDFVENLQPETGLILQVWCYNLSSMLEPCSYMVLVDESMQRSYMTKRKQKRKNKCTIRAI